MTDIDDLLAERERTHGDYRDVASISMRLKKAMRSHERLHGRLPIEAVEALDMIAVKIARIIAGDAEHADHWRDIAGYATLIADMCEGKR